jgi:hypothetical protein
MDGSGNNVVVCVKDESSKARLLWKLYAMNPESEEVDLKYWNLALGRDPAADE